MILKKIIVEMFILIKYNSKEKGENIICQEKNLIVQKNMLILE